MTKFFCVIPALVLATTLLAADPPATPKAAGPRIVFQTPIYDFGKVKSGEPVKYTFIFTNTGDELLILTNVQPSCGCTTAGDWSKQVEPGKTGTIPVQFNSANYNGPVQKTVTVTSNDKNQPVIGLQLKGTIWKPIEVNPQFAMLNVSPESPASGATIVHVVNNMEEPLSVWAPEVNNAAFSLELKTNEPGKSYQVSIRVNPPPDVGNVQGTVTLKTSSTNMPTINVTAWANVQPVITVNPPTISLPVAPLATRQSASVMIVNNGTNTLVLTEPTVNVKDVDVKLSESQPGKLFNAMLTFPEGFEVPQGTKAELTIKSNHPKYPMLKVPINQLIRTTPGPVVHQAAAPIAPPAPVPAPQAIK